MKVRFTGQAEASVTYLGKYQVETGTVLENVSDDDGNILLQTGHFEVLAVPSGSGDDKSKKSETAGKDGGSKGSKGK